MPEAVPTEVVAKVAAAAAMTTSLRADELEGELEGELEAAHFKNTDATSADSAKAEELFPPADINEEPTQIPGLLIEAKISSAQHEFECDAGKAKVERLREDFSQAVVDSRPAMSVAAPADLSGRWRVEKCGGYLASEDGGDVEGFAEAMGASLVTRKAFAAAVALLNRSMLRKYYIVRQHGNDFNIVVNDGDVLEHTECFTAGVVQSSKAWHDPLAKAEVRVAAAWWEGKALHTEVCFVSTSAQAYEAEWRLHGEQLRYTLSRGDESMWVLLSLAPIP